MKQFALNFREEDMMGSREGSLKQQFGGGESVSLLRFISLLCFYRSQHSVFLPLWLSQSLRSIMQLIGFQYFA